MDLLYLDIFLFATAGSHLVPLVKTGSNTGTGFCMAGDDMHLASWKRDCPRANVNLAFYITVLIEFPEHSCTTLGACV